VADAVEGRIEGQRVDVVPVRVGDEQVGVDARSLRRRERIGERLDAGPGVEHEEPAVGEGHAGAGGVAAVAHRIPAGDRQRAAHAPEADDQCVGDEPREVSRKACEVERLLEEAVGAHLERPPPLEVIRLRGHHHELRSAQLRQRFQAPAQLVAVEPGHHDVHQHAVGALARDLGERRDARVVHLDLMSLALEQPAGDLGLRAAVVDDVDAQTAAPDLPPPGIVRQGSERCQANPLVGEGSPGE